MLVARLTDQEKQDILRHLDADKPLPDKYRFLLFGDKREVELVWNGKTGDICDVVLPFQTIERVDEPRLGAGSNKSDGVRETDLLPGLYDARGRQAAGWANKLIWGDNRLILSSLKNGPLRREIQEQGGLKLIYIDPPFDVGADFSMDVEVGDEQGDNTLTKKPNVLEKFAYRDTWGKGQDSFISMIYERLQLMHDLLTDDGNIYVHCGVQVNHLMRTVLTEIFGASNFVSELIWAYGTPSGGRASGTKAVKVHEYILHFAKNYRQRIEHKLHTPYSAKYIAERFANVDESGRKYRERKRGNGEIQKQYLDESPGVPLSTVWSDVKQTYAMHLKKRALEEVGYPTQKPEALLDRIIQVSSNEGDLVADFFCGSGTTAAVAEKLGRKWICADLGKFAIHTTRKRLIEVQRRSREAGEEYRAFEVLNLGKYEREHYVGLNPNLRDEQKRLQLAAKEAEFLNLILNAYKAEGVPGFETFHGKKAGRMVAVGPINLPVTRLFVEKVILEAREKHVSKVDILGFEFEMGLFPNLLNEARAKGVDIAPKCIPAEVFDKRAVARDEVTFHDVAYIEVRIREEGSGVAVELTDFSVHYTQGTRREAEESLRKSKPGSKLIVENGQVVRLSKDKDGIMTSDVLTKSWTDWIDYWSVDFDYESKREIVRVKDPASGEWKEEWTGEYIFENEWQSFRTKGDRSLALKSEPHPVEKKRRKVAIKVVDIFGNDTMTIREVG